MLKKYNHNVHNNHNQQFKVLKLLKHNKHSRLNKPNKLSRHNKLSKHNNRTQINQLKKKMVISQKQSLMKMVMFKLMKKQMNYKVKIAVKLPESSWLKLQKLLICNQLKQF